jgi:Family of unknown function (DUF5701)
VLDTAARPTTARSTTAWDPALELDRQVQALVDAGVPALAGLSADELAALAAPLRDRLPQTGAGDLPLVLVVGRQLVPPAALVPLLRLRGKAGTTSMSDEDVASFVPRDDVEVPSAPLYLLHDVDLGRATLDVPPAVALPRLVAAGRSPLTVEEGLSVVLQRPEVLREVCCSSLLGSRCGDRRVPALWVKRGGQPRLGWCWEGAPHSWLGSASCAARAA